MEFLLSDKCCGCIDLQTGTLILSGILLIYKVFWFISNTLSMVMLLQLYAHMPNVIIDIVNMASLIEFVVFVDIVFSAAMIVSLMKKKNPYLKPVFVMSSVCFVIEIIFFIYGFRRADTSPTYIVLTIVDTLFKAMNIYFVMVVCSHIKNGKGKEEQSVVYSNYSKTLILL